MTLTPEAQAERDAFVSYLDDCIAAHVKHQNKKGQIVVRKHHLAACRNIRAAVLAGEHHEKWERP